jgi:hypothetical protein
MKARLSLLLLLSSVAVLPGCQAAAVGSTATPIIFQKKHVNLVNASYAAIETLIQKSNVRLDRNEPFVVHPLNEVIHKLQDDGTGIPRVTRKPNPNLGKALTNRMTTRVREMGYNVVPSDTSPRTGVEVNGIFDLYGGYFLGRDQKMKVTLQLSDIATKRVISEHDFIIPVTDEVREYMDSDNVYLPSFFRD